jgi:DNA-directed RNA polymerase subunit alpha
VQHEFSTIPGVVEDVTDIVLNIKGLIVKNYSEARREVRIEKDKRGVVTGADVVTDGQIEILNKDHLIATLTDDVPFVIHLTIDSGRGYIPATDRAGESEIGVIPVDAVFSPVVRVKYEIEETRVGQKTNYDKLIMEIWTNGTVGPEMALVEAAKILRKHLNPFVQYAEMGAQVHARSISSSMAGMADAAIESKLNLSIAELKLSVRATNCLESENINTVRDLVSRSEDDLLEVRNFGETTLKEVKQKLIEIGLNLGMRLPAGV